MSNQVGAVKVAVLVSCFRNLLCSKRDDVECAPVRIQMMKAFNIAFAKFDEFDTNVIAIICEKC